MTLSLDRPLHYRCRTCLVGSTDPYCWHCGQRMDCGSVTLLNRTSTDKQMLEARTHLDPADHLDLKVLDGLTIEHYARNDIGRPQIG